MYTRKLSRANGFFRGNCFEFEARRFRKEKEHYERHHQPEHREIPNREPMRSGRTIEQALKKEAQGAASRSCNRQYTAGSGAIGGGKQFRAVRECDRA